MAAPSILPEPLPLNLLHAYVFNAGQVEYNHAGVHAFLRGFLIRGENYMVFKRFYSLLFSRRGLLILACVSTIFATPAARAQSLGNAGTVEGNVTDPSGSSLPGAKVTIRNAVSGYSQSATTATD